MVGKESIYLVINNTLENGENEAVLEYSEYLALKYNIVVHHQFPQSYKINILDLGAWMIV